MKINKKMSLDVKKENGIVSSAVVAVVAMSVGFDTYAETVRQSAEVPSATLSMCATAAFRNKNINVCSEIEQKAKPLATNSGSLPPSGSVPSTSPNYLKTVK